MNVICFFNSFFGISGGDVRFVEVFSRLDGLEKTIVTPSLGEDFCRSYGLHASYVTTTHESHFGNVMFTYARRIAVALSLKLKMRNAVVYSTSDFLPDVLPAFLYTRKHPGASWIQVIHHVIPAKREGSFLTDFISYSAQRISFFLIKRYSNMVITVSPIVKCNLAEMGFSSERVRINANGVDVDYFKRLEPYKPFYDGIFIGRLHASKGIFDLIKIWKVVCSVRPAKLGIIGDGDSGTREALKHEIQRQGLSRYIDILGCLESEEAYRTIKASKVFVFPSHEEGFGIAILEAMACGLPVVAWNLPVYESIFPKGLIEVGNRNYQVFAKKVLALLENECLRRSLGRDGTGVASKYNWDDIAKQECALIKS